MTWFVAMILLFGVFVGFMVFNKPWQKFTGVVDPKIPDTYTANDGSNARELLPIFKRNQALVPVILMGVIVLWAFLASLKQDPNYPVQ